jgi:hypothetical protein
MIVTVAVFVAGRSWHRSADRVRSEFTRYPSLARSVRLDPFDCAQTGTVRSVAAATAGQRRAADSGLPRQRIPTAEDGALESNELKFRTD